MGIMKRTTSNKFSIMPLAIMLIGMLCGAPVKAFSQALDGDTASVTVKPDADKPLTDITTGNVAELDTANLATDGDTASATLKPNADVPFTEIDTTMVETPDTGSVESPVVPGGNEDIKEPVVVDDATLRAMIVEFIEENSYYDDFNAIDSAFQVRLGILNVETTIEDVHSVLEEEFDKINSADDIPGIDYFVKKIMNSNKYQGGSGLVGIEEVEVDEEKGDGAIYDLSGIRLPAQPRPSTAFTSRTARNTWPNNVNENNAMTVATGSSTAIIVNGMT